MNRYEKSLITLELPAVLELLAARAAGEEAKARCRALVPADTEYTVRALLEETGVAREMLAAKGSPSFTGAKDVRGALSRADLGGVLTPRELLAIAGVLQCARQTKAYGEGGGELWQPLYTRFAALSANRFLEEKITAAIPAEDEIADGASRELSDIRRKLRLANERVREALQKIISSPTYAKVLQEPIITTRSERFVVPVKAEQKSAVPGLVHDVSASGATVFVEPMAAVRANNEIRELKAKERQEIERILAELSADCAQHREGIALDFALLTELDVIFAKAKLADWMDAAAPRLSEAELILRHARHPLLPKDSAVPISVRIGGEYDTLVITGPNTGGKTVSIKTMGLLSVMTLCGLHIPVADGSCVPVFTQVLADIGDEQSIEQSLSTFSAHMTNIVEILKSCGEGGDRTLLLFDELGAGTDPTEGAALAVAVIERARSMGALVAATTHYAELKVYATTQPGVQNASCEFDVESLRPTYRLLTGVPGRSNAFAISQRLGLPEDVIADARRRIDAESAGMEEMLKKLEQERRRLEEMQAEAARQLRKSEEDAKKSAQMRAELSVRLERADEKARRDAQRILEDARQQAERVFQELDRIRALESKNRDHLEVNEARAALRREMNAAEDALSERPAETLPGTGAEKSARPVRPGDTVLLRSMGGVKATVLSVSPERVLELQAGILKVSAREDEVTLTEAEKPKKRAQSQKPAAALRGASVASEIDLRGLMSDEAVLAAERYLDAAAMAKLQTVTIIHGKGTGALRQAIQTALRHNKLVKSFRNGVYGEGEMGVTVVELR